MNLKRNIVKTKMLLKSLLSSIAVVLFPLCLNASDADYDLVPDSKDLCPNTPDGVFVDKLGCTKHIKKTIYFDHASWTIDLEDKDLISSIVTIAQELQGYKIYIQGHTDATADPKTNLYFSKKRAMNVYNTIVKDIDMKRIVVSWYGESQPIASNTTEEGKQNNRRVSIVLR